MENNPSGLYSDGCSVSINSQSTAYECIQDTSDSTLTTIPIAKHKTDMAITNFEFENARVSYDKFPTDLWQIIIEYSISMKDYFTLLQINKLFYEICSNANVFADYACIFKCYSNKPLYINEIHQSVSLYVQSNT